MNVYWEKQKYLFLHAVEISATIDGSMLFFPGVPGRPIMTIKNTWRSALPKGMQVILLQPMFADLLQKLDENFWITPYISQSS